MVSAIPGMRKKNGSANIKPSAGRLAKPRRQSKIPRSKEIHPKTRKTTRTLGAPFNLTIGIRGDILGLDVRMGSALFFLFGLVDASLDLANLFGVRHPPIRLDRLLYTYARSDNRNTVRIVKLGVILS